MYLLKSISLASLFMLISGMKNFPNFGKEWEAFKVAHSKQYNNEAEEDLRMKIFADNLVKIARHNALYAKGQKSYSMKMNRFGDMLPKEIHGMMNGLRSDEDRANRHRQSVPFVKQGLRQSLPKSLDWREKGAVTPIKDQGYCGSCWAFSVTGAIEGQNFLKTGQLLSLSEQDLVDCSEKNYGCDGGLMTTAFEDIILMGGIESEKSYPYEGYDETCKFEKSLVAVSIKNYTEIPSNDEEALLEALGTVGPISVAIDASQDSFQFYDEGIYDDPYCDPDYLCHAVLAVGYGEEEDGSKYWIVKNSWGESWGDKGYIKMKRGENQCGIASEASYPLL